MQLRQLVSENLMVSIVKYFIGTSLLFSVRTMRNTLEGWFGLNDFAKR